MKERLTPRFQILAGTANINYELRITNYELCIVYYELRIKKGAFKMIFCVEDEQSIRELVVYTLNSTGFNAKGFSSSTEMFAELETTVPKLVILDIMLPGDDGLTILKKLREQNETKDIPIMMATAKGNEYDKVAGLDLGADDYLVKPFGMMELVARVKALLRRTTNSGSEKSITVGDITVDTVKHSVTANGKNITLTLKEFEILCMLIEQPERVFTRDNILSRIWGFEFDGETRTVDVHMRTLRQKLGEAGAQIKTVRGVGYNLVGAEK